jgi:two-component system nitrogen regulation sensor histidine kinase GlnL
MASILAHEVKNPLSGIRGAAQLLQKTVSPDDQQLTELICTEVDRIRDVIEEMEIFSNPSELKTESLNIHEVLQYVRLLAEKGVATHVEFREIYDPSIPDVSGNRNLLIQLFLNIVKNAAEALITHDRAVITLTTSYQSGFRLKPQGGSRSRSLPIVVCIEDNGPGIPTELHGNIFDPFVTTKEGGKGLGLAVVAKIVADHGGVIELDKEVKEGTRFRILLPAA